MISSIQYRRCEMKDLHALKEVSESTFAVAFARFNTPEDMHEYMSEAFAIDRISKELSDPDVAYYFAEVQGKIAGYIKLNARQAQTDLQDPHSLELERIYVLQAYQNQGIGQSLLTEAIRLAKEEGCHYLWLGVWDQNEGAIRFYQRHGFRTFGKHDFFLGKDRQSDYLMRYELEI